MDGCVGARIPTMNSDRIKNALREALREEAERLADNRASMALLFAGAEMAVAKRLGVVPDAKLDDDDHDAYKAGWQIGSQVALY